MESYAFLKSTNTATGDTVKTLNSAHLRVLKNLSVIERSLLLGGYLKNIITFGTIQDKFTSSLSWILFSRSFLYKCAAMLINYVPL